MLGKVFAYFPPALLLFPHFFVPGLETRCCLKIGIGLGIWCLYATLISPHHGHPEKALHQVMIVKMMMTFVCSVVTNTPPQFVGSAMRGIALNVLALTIVGMKLCMLHHNSAILVYIGDLPMHKKPYIISLEHNPRQGLQLSIAMHESFLVLP